MILWLGLVCTLYCGGRLWWMSRPVPVPKVKPEAPPQKVVRTSVTRQNTPKILQDPLQYFTEEDMIWWNRTQNLAGLDR